MSDFDAPLKLLCLSCGTLVEPSELVESRCPHCGEPIDSHALLKLYEYAAETYYYGHQYRTYYEEAFRRDKEPPRFSLAFGGEAFAWIMLAVLSGVVGNAAYDLVKIVVARIREDVAAGKLPDRDYTALLTLSDDELGELVQSANHFHGGMDGLTQEVRHAIVEEIVADTISHEPKLATEMGKLMNKKTVRPKDRQRFSTLLRHAVAKHHRRTLPDPRKFLGLWSKVEGEDEG